MIWCHIQGDLSFLGDYSRESWSCGVWVDLFHFLKFFREIADSNYGWLLGKYQVMSFVFFFSLLILDLSPVFLCFLPYQEPRKAPTERLSYSLENGFPGARPNQAQYNDLNMLLVKHMRLGVRSFSRSAFDFLANFSHGNGLIQSFQIHRSHSTEYRCL